MKVYGHNDYAIYYHITMQILTMPLLKSKRSSLKAGFFTHDQFISGKTVYFMLESNNRLFLK